LIESGMIETERLILRRWRDADREPYAAMSADPQVMDWLGRAPMTRAESDAQIDRFEAQFETLGHGFFALERKADGAFLGFIALAPVPPGPPRPEGCEIGWRLARPAWGHGYATEGARALLAHGFTHLKLPEIISFTARTNLRSQAVMQRIGLAHDPARDFNHPALATDDPLRPHVVYFKRGA
jgi:RimJ/RimL family protein N-acetyltransferase